VTFELLINAGAGETRIALLRDGRLEDYAVEQAIHPKLKTGDIILGRVKKIVPGMQAAFVDIGTEREGFLALSDARPLSRKDAPTISDCVREGEAVTVQIVKLPFGEKGARLTADPALPARLLVLTPLRPGLTVSRAVPARAALETLGEQMLEKLGRDFGFILRTEAAGASLEALIAAAQSLIAAWRALDAHRKSAAPPALLHAEPGAMERALRDLVPDAIRIDDAQALEAARAFCRRAAPGLESRLAYAPPPLFDEALEEEIAALARPRMALPSGGWITIEPTEALIAVDVNSGNLAGSAGLSETALTTNLEAARAIGRQVRLRGIGGLIVIDFLQMQETAHHARVVEALRQALAGRVPFQISPMTDFGIVAVTRKRTAAVPGESCATCRGAGRVPSIERLALDLLGAVEREARANPGREIVASAAPAVADWIGAHEDDVCAALARRGAGRVRFEADDTKARERFDVHAV
jgi:ribonuclease G